MDLGKAIQMLQRSDLLPSVYFVRKKGEEYIAYSPEVSPSITWKLLADAASFLKPFTHFEQCTFNPTGCKDDTIEVCKTDYVGNYEEVVGSLMPGNVDDLEDQVDNLSFYCIDVQSNSGDLDLKLFRRVTKFKRLYSKGMLAAFQGGKVNQMNDKILGLDGFVDLISFEGEVAIFSHVALERIFKLREQYASKAGEALRALRNSNKIVNFDAFEEDCLGDLRMQKILTKMLGENEKLSTCFEPFDKVVQTIEIFELDIETQKAPQEGIIYEDKGQILDILRFAKDSYYQSFIRQQLGIDDK